ncbi:PTS ascorbate transporter subunit IIC [Carnobacterium divergens]|uniref:PTS ascorbate transporter subunit IIC n=3 Tax=Carnobacterium TaxID=2747 RepID=UPI00288FF525|nr:PTS ascorbate transporter subunit IIC [Carnobacterium divergens]MDT1939036.1 PTS ascorbate transporter subunit IIC [Carnobacterium divergens]MDT1941474.1 PTS ascorbate transporter subunit IIC [Carnobacterium divergens]MDT1947272.1 PTS ascorbate transporter subunit IIC [Carnobacterium divergens]MDT1949710.1 PTS ascorbate transporter subunit IIC [Carnobacterium divergens]MDT1954888.1 PTS ascorbate transporter subunit IIC [Carnobacterium divergens]
MTLFLGLFEWFANNILQKPEFFIGIIVFIGYVLLKKPLYECFAGFVKATVGYMILNVGAGGLVTTFRPILAGLNDRFNLDAAVIDPYFGLNAVNAALENIGISTSWTMISLLLGFSLNIVLVLFRKLTKLRTLFITGHIMVQQATTVTWIVFFLFPEFRNLTGGIMVGILVGLYWAVSSNLTVGPTQRLTGNAGFAIGHQQMFAVWLTDKVAGKLGNPEKNLENIKLPKWLSIFHDNIVATGTLMLFFFGVIMTILGEDYLREINPAFTATTSFPMYIISQSLYLAVYLAILMQGVRMFVAELTNSFQGISNRILPGSLPAVDCAATYNFAPNNAVLFGFIFGAIGQFITILSLVVFKSPVLIITGFVPVFFDNATIAVFANKRGGTKAAMICSFVSGVLQVSISAFAVMLFGLYKYGGWHGNIDFELFWPWAGVLMKYLGFIGFVIICFFFLAIPQLQYHFSKNKKDYNDGLE